MDRERYLQSLTVDGGLLLDAARGDLSGAVPGCPGWTGLDVVGHLAEVYEHKIEAIRLAGARPDPWPPPWPVDRDATAWLADAHRRLLGVLRDTDPQAPSWTWWPGDQTAGFWTRRMAQETAVHRVDVQGAVGDATPVDETLALDGIDEILTLMVAGDWSDEVQADSVGNVTVVGSVTGDGVVTGDGDGVAAGDGRAWRISLAPDAVTVAESTPAPGAAGEAAGPAEASVSGPASDVLLWLWGRVPDRGVTIDGDRTTTTRLRQRLSAATQ